MTEVPSLHRLLLLIVRIFLCFTAHKDHYNEHGPALMDFDTLILTAPLTLSILKPVRPSDTFQFLLCAGLRTCDEL